MNPYCVLHKNLTPGFWYLRVDYEPFYDIVSIVKMMIGPDEGELVVFSIDHEGYHYIADFANDQFICKVTAP